MQALIHHNRLWFEMIGNILHRTAVCGLVGVTIYGLFLIGRGAIHMEKARREARLVKAINDNKEVNCMHPNNSLYFMYCR